MSFKRSAKIMTIMLCVVMLSVVMLIATIKFMYWMLFMLSVVMLSVTIKSNVLNFVYAECRYTDCRGTSTISSICYNLLLQTHVINLTISFVHIDIAHSNL